uniref:hypothetical protein n=1 Tax=Paractinoplanes polyasparticus TaxID=2856853 RepID=UPI001C84D28A|nr:hypothetical protein [Actinoplanes polyasparticus]
MFSATMGGMPGPGGRRFPVGPLAVAALLILILSGLSLDRADKLASIAALFVALAGFVYNYRPGGADGSAPAEPAADPGPGSGSAAVLVRRGAARLGRLLLGEPKIPLGLAAAAIAAVGVIGVAVTYIVGGPETPSTSQVVSPSLSPTSELPSSPPSEPASSPPDVVDCPQAGTPPPIASPSSNTVRRQARMKLPALYYGDLDSTCPDWGIKSGRDSSRHDIVNDGTGLFHGSDTEISKFDGGKVPTYEGCLKSTTYLAAPIAYASLKPGDRYCVKTIDRDRSRQSLLTVVSSQRSASGRTVVLDVRTWATTRAADVGDDSWAIVAGIVIAVLVFGGGGATAASKGKGKGKGKRTRNDRKDG